MFYIIVFQLIYNFPALVDKFWWSTHSSTLASVPPMMPIPIIQIFKVIFVLSTIVAVTDCCSSRILLLREHTLNIVQHQHNHLHEHAHELQQQEMAYASQWELQQLQEQQQLEAAAQEAALEANTDLELCIDPISAQSVETSTESSLASGILSSSTDSWSTIDSSTPVTPLQLHLRKQRFFVRC
ncbi:uncharacterized protein Dana_GF20173 [Drosophila ananassae]|uniref:Uncharacterized protein n=1 Tax=Drosophila ananassae TaxID=7217 RepID=B3MPX3_DROAN|nr:uncharacterized protein Dana_GF20173 [Drosophila ananassae]